MFRQFSIITEKRSAKCKGSRCCNLISLFFSNYATAATATAMYSSNYLELDATVGPMPTWGKSVYKKIGDELLVSSQKLKAKEQRQQK